MVYTKAEAHLPYSRFHQKMQMLNCYINVNIDIAACSF